MILKIATEKGWKFSDNIKDFYYTLLSAKEYKEANKKYTFYNLIHHSDDCSFKELFLELKNGGSEIWITDSEFYLMSDEGKTIERIN
jgi:hypothetical protein